MWQRKNGEKSDRIIMKIKLEKVVACKDTYYVLDKY